MAWPVDAPAGRLQGTSQAGGGTIGALLPWAGAARVSQVDRMPTDSHARGYMGPLPVSVAEDWGSLRRAETPCSPEEVAQQPRSPLPPLPGHQLYEVAHPLHVLTPLQSPPVFLRAPWLQYFRSATLQLLFQAGCSLI